MSSNSDWTFVLGKNFLIIIIAWLWFIVKDGEKPQNCLDINFIQVFMVFTNLYRFLSCKLDLIEHVVWVSVSAVHSLGSPQWDECGGMDHSHEDTEFSLPRFLLALRVLMRSAFAVCLITIPTHLFQVCINVLYKILFYAMQILIDINTMKCSIEIRPTSYDIDE